MFRRVFVTKREELRKLKEELEVTLHFLHSVVKSQ